MPSGGVARVSFPVRAGRAFHAGDLAPDSRVVIVNESFVRLVLGGRRVEGMDALVAWSTGDAGAADEAAFRAHTQTSDFAHWVVDRILPAVEKAVNTAPEYAELKAPAPAAVSVMRAAVSYSAQFG